MKRIFFYSLFISLFMTACGQSPEIKTYIYSQVTTPGAPMGNDKNPFPKKYFIYAEIKKGTSITAEGLWIDGKYFSVSGVEKVNSPVIVETQTAIKMEKETLVNKTVNDVYRINVGEEKSRAIQNETEKKLVGENKAVLILIINGKQEFAASATIKELTPAVMM